MLTRNSSSSLAGWLLAIGAALFGIGAFVHPRGEQSSDLDRTLLGMLESPMWVASHLVVLAALIVLSVAMTRLLRSGQFAGNVWAERFAWLVVVGTAATAVEHVPHILAASEAAALAAGQPTPMVDTHLLLQAIFLPLYGIGVTGLALSLVRRLVHPIVAAIGVVGGVAVALVAPLLAITGIGTFAILFLPASGTWIFLLLVGIRLGRGAANQVPATSCSQIA